MVLNIRTALDEDSAQQLTVVTVNFDGCTLDLIKVLASRSAVIDEQRKWRKAKLIPATATIKVADLATKVVRQEATPASLTAMGATLDLEGQRKLIADLQAQLATAEGAKALDTELEAETAEPAKGKRK